jgi:ABC-2 type transport system ATP-binding protein
MLKAGRVVALDTTHNLLSRFSGISVRLSVQRLPQRWYARVLRQEEGLFLLGLESHAELESLLADLRVEGIAIEDLALAETDLEEVFLRTMRDAVAPRA